MPAEARNRSYQFHLLFRTSDSLKTPLSVEDFEGRHRLLMSFIPAKGGLNNEIRSVLLGDNLLHLTGTPFHRFRQTRSQPLTVKYSTLDIAQHDFWGATMQLPPQKWHRLFQFVKVTLHVPPLELPQPFNLLSRFHASIWAAREMDWLLSLRERHRWGFGRLELLEVDIIFPKHVQSGSSTGQTSGSCTRDAIAKMQLDAARTSIVFKLADRDCVNRVPSLSSRCREGI